MGVMSPILDSVLVDVWRKKLEKQGFRVELAAYYLSERHGHVLQRLGHPPDPSPLIEREELKT